MTDPFRTPEDYELFLYTLSERFPSIQRSTLTFVRRGHSLARVAGEIFFARKIRLVVRERLVLIAYRCLSTDTATKLGKERRSCTGTTRNLIPMSRVSRAPILITSTSFRT
jgi:hypothetical protein